MTFITSEMLFFISIGLVALIIILFVWNIFLEVRIKNLMRGKNGQSLESAFLSMDADIREYKKFKTELEQYLQKVEKRLGTSIRGVENLNFNAFSGAESGGKSFATAIINEQGNGIIISSLQARDKLSIFTKKIINGKSEIPLSTEEQESLTKALKSCSL